MYKWKKKSLKKINNFPNKKVFGIIKMLRILFKNIKIKINSN